MCLSLLSGLCVYHEENIILNPAVAGDAVSGLISRRSVLVMNKSVRKLLVTTAIAIGTLYAGVWRAEADYLQTDLVSDIPGLATITDPLLMNPWGISRSATSPFWISNQVTNSSTLYAVTGSTNVTKVTAVNAQGFVNIPTTANGPQGPTGQVNNSNTASFQLTPGDTTSSARFIFANLNGTISAWAGGLAASIQVTTPNTVYTGLAINQAQTRLYAASATGINVFDGSFSPLSLGAGAFTTHPRSARLDSFRLMCRTSAAISM
jgi:hypothetical protein